MITDTQKRKRLQWIDEKLRERSQELWLLEWEIASKKKVLSDIRNIIIKDKVIIDWNLEIIDWLKLSIDELDLHIVCKSDNFDERINNYNRYIKKLKTEILKLEEKLLLDKAIDLTENKKKLDHLLTVLTKQYSLKRKVQVELNNQWLTMTELENKKKSTMRTMFKLQNDLEEKKLWLKKKERKLNLKKERLDKLYLDYKINKNVKK